jgi:hypothetical protein
MNPTGAVAVDRAYIIVELTVPLVGVRKIEVDQLVVWFKDISKLVGGVRIMLADKPVPDTVNFCINGEVEAAPKHALMLPVTWLTVIFWALEKNIIDKNIKISKNFFMKFILVKIYIISQYNIIKMKKRIFFKL